MKTNPQRKEQIDVQILEKQTHKHVLILFNDDYNTFEHVIQCLIEVCNHTEQQAEQCAWLVHYKGKCEVKTGAFEDLKKRCKYLQERGLSTEVI